MTEKVLGYLFLIIGFVVLITSLSNVYLIMTKQAMPVAYVDLEEISISSNTNMNLDALPEDVRKLIRVNPNQEPVKLLSKQAMNDISNLTIHLFVMSFFLNAGAQLARIGATIIRPNIIKLSPEDEKNIQTRNIT